MFELYRVNGVQQHAEPIPHDQQRREGVTVGYRLEAPYTDAELNSPELFELGSATALFIPTHEINPQGQQKVYIMLFTNDKNGQLLPQLGSVYVGKDPVTIGKNSSNNDLDLTQAKGIQDKHVKLFVDQGKLILRTIGQSSTRILPENALPLEPFTASPSTTATSNFPYPTVFYESPLQGAMGITITNDNGKRIGFLLSTDAQKRHGLYLWDEQNTSYIPVSPVLENVFYFLNSTPLATDNIVRGENFLTLPLRRDNGMYTNAIFMILSHDGEPHLFFIKLGSYDGYTLTRR